MFKPIRACGWLKSLFDPKVVRKVLADLMHYFCVASVIAAAWPFFSVEAHLGVRIVLRAVILTSIAGVFLVAAALLTPLENEKSEGAAGAGGSETPPVGTTDPTMEEHSTRRP